MKFIITYIHGILIGIANIIPGLSGGTIAYVVGIYERFINILSNPKIILKDKSERNFMLVLALGIVSGIVIFTIIFGFILKNESYKQHFYFFIIGTIVGTIIFTVKTEKGYSLKNLGILILVLLIFVVIENIKPPFSNELPEVIKELYGVKLTKVDFGYSIWLGICGLLAASSMLLPGFSGSALLVTLGEYENIFGFLHERMIFQIGFVGIGAVVGILVVAKLLAKLMKKYKIEMIYVIIALMLTSIYKLYSEIMGDMIYGQLLISIISFVIGGYIAYYFSAKKR